MFTRTLIGGALALTAGIVIFLIVQMSNMSDGRVKVGPRPAAAACDKNPAACLPRLTMVDTMGNAYPPDALVGKVVVVNFWATWCRPCQHEIPAFSKVYERYKDRDVVMIGIMTDDPDAQTLLNFASDHELLYPVVRADQDIRVAFGDPEAIPTTLVFDRRGLERKRHRGALSERQLAGVLDELLSEI